MTVASDVVPFYLEINLVKEKDGIKMKGEKEGWTTSC